MTHFRCAACGQALTVVLQQVAEMPVRPEWDGLAGEGGVCRAPATVGAGFYAVESEPWGASSFVGTDDVDPVLSIFPGGPCVPDGEGDGRLVSVGSRHTVVLHPDDAPWVTALDLREKENWADHWGRCRWARWARWTGWTDREERKESALPLWSRGGRGDQRLQYRVPELHLEPGRVTASDVAGGGEPVCVTG
ncbi:hypothetical protein DY245_41195 [Streptomyces inhibens]|uniref:Uncharacterized protein n=1 Tax=Streptomyces inhibens TaxID=2293571 RepID=A0A371PQQ7_STRIH|nr:hypothetical protein DY245_41195 [Streptomyces inhibens]